jgi:hypothetical protein
VNGDILDELEPYLTKHPWHLKMWVLIPKATLILVCCFTWNLECWSKTEYWGFALEPTCSRTMWVDLLKLRGPTVVINYHTKLLQSIIALELANLNIWNYSLAFDGSCSSIETTCYRSAYGLFFYSGSLHRAFTNWSHVGLSSQGNGSLS